MVVVLVCEDRGDVLSFLGQCLTHNEKGKGSFSFSAQTKTCELCESCMKVWANSLPGPDPLWLVLGRNDGQEVPDSQVSRYRRRVGCGRASQANDASMFGTLWGKYVSVNQLSLRVLEKVPISCFQLLHSYMYLSDMLGQSEKNHKYNNPDSLFETLGKLF